MNTCMHLVNLGVCGILAFALGWIVTQGLLGLAAFVEHLLEQENRRRLLLHLSGWVAFGLCLLNLRRGPQAYGVVDLVAIFVLFLYACVTILLTTIDGVFDIRDKTRKKVGS